jgi:hypothetical protein
VPAVAAFSAAAAITGRSAGAQSAHRARKAAVGLMDRFQIIGCLLSQSGEGTVELPI